MTVRDVWVRRVRTDLTKRWKTWRLLFDWTIVLYGGIPLTFFLGYQYVAMWQGAYPWLMDVPMLAWAAGLLLIQLHDHFFAWIERADVALVANRDLVSAMKRYSVGYHLAGMGMKYTLVLGLMAPVLKLHGWSLVSLVAFGFALFVVAWLHMWLRYLLDMKGTHWSLRLLVPVVAFSGTYALLADMPLLAVVLGSGSVALALVSGEGWLSRHPFISREVEHAARVRTAFDRSLLSTSGVFEKPNTRKRPYYRPTPNRFGSVRRTLALLLYIRTPSHRNLWLRLIPLAVTGFLLVPSWFKLLIPLYIGYVGIQERDAFLNEMERHPFFRMTQGRTD